MTATEARASLIEWMRKGASEEFPLVWVGELLEEDTDEYIFEAAPYAEGENPKDEALPHAVNKLTGPVELRVPLY